MSRVLQLNDISRRWFDMAICLSLAVLLCGCDRAALLDHSLETLGARANFQYQALEKIDHGSLTDSAAIWKLSIQSLDEADLTKAGIRPARYEDDVLYFKAEVQRRFSGIGNLEDFRLWRGEIVLGEGTICAQNHCNIYLLYDAKSGEAFVDISRT